MIRKLSSTQLFFILSGFLIVSMVIGALLPQGQPLEKYSQFLSPNTIQILQKLGFLNLFHSPWFVGLLVLLAINTAACILMRIKDLSFSRLPWGALLSHCAILIILAGGVISGIAGENGFLELKVNESNCCVSPIAEKKSMIHLPFQVRLANFSVEHYDSGKHWIQVANLKEGWNQVVEVQPGNEYWVNKSVRLNVLRYVPDFRVEKDAANGQWKTYSASLAPNNPALQVEVTASPKRMVWLFAKYPELSSHFTGETKNKENHLDLTYQFVPGKVKQYKSKIEIVKDNQVLANGETSVNHPFQYGGYNFFQSGYNPEDPSFSSFQVSKDPGVPVVYAGFVLLPLGLTLSFYGGRNT